MSPEIFAGVGQPVEQSSERTIYAINCQPADGEPHDLAGGVMQCYHLFPGIDLAYTQFRAGRCRMRERAFSDVLEIAYCQAGRFECEYKHGFVTFLGEGDFAVSVLSPEQQPPSFPLGTYDGVTLIVDRALTGPCSCGIVEGVSIDWRALAEKFCSDTCCSVARAGWFAPRFRRDLGGAGAATAGVSQTESAGMFLPAGRLAPGGAFGGEVLFAEPDRQSEAAGRGAHLQPRQASAARSAGSAIWHEPDGAQGLFQGCVWQTDRHLSAGVPHASGSALARGN